MAAGLRIEEDKLDAFRAAFCELAAAEIRPAAAAADLKIDAEAPLSAFTLQAVHQIERLAPFGEHNARPLLCTSGATLVGPPKPMGDGGRHLSMKLSQHGVVFRAVAFGGAEWADELAALEPAHRRRLPPRHQHLSRPAQRGIAPGRLADDRRAIPPSDAETPAWRPSIFQQAQQQMVRRQLRRRGIRDPRVLAAMGRVPRERSSAPSSRDEAYADVPWPSIAARRSASPTWWR